MKIPEKGMSETGLFERLEQYKASDLAMRGGRMFGHAFFASEQARLAAERAYTMYLWENALDPTLFPSLLRLESELVAMSAAHLNGDEKVVGNFTSGGTESILLAVKAARERAREKRPGLQRPEMILPVTAHAAFHKAAHYFCLETVPIPVDPVTFKADVEAVRNAITPSTALIVASAPSYAHGVIDPIPEIGKLAQEHNVPLHVDGCMGAFLLPYFRRLGAEVTDFDFSVPGVTSISMDFHKYAYSPKGASMILYRDKELRRHQIFACSDWTGYTVINPTVQSSRSGGPLAAAWAMLHLLGDEGYMDLARALMEATARVIAGVGKIPDLHVLGRPEMCILGIGSDTVNVFHLVDEMKVRGWHIQAQMGLDEMKENFHLTILPFNVGMIDRWLADLEECVAIAREKGDDSQARSIARALAGQDAGPPQGEDLAGIFKAVGIEGGELPERMALINQILNALPPETADRMFISFVNELGGSPPRQEVTKKEKE